VVTRGTRYSFVPSNLWVAVGWRNRDDIEVDLTEVMDRRGIALRPEGAARVPDFGDSGVAFVAQPQIPPRNVNWSSSGRWVHYAKIGFEKYFLRKIWIGKSEPFYERFALQALAIDKLKQTQSEV
jgi:hypothetical protein